MSVKLIDKIDGNEFYRVDYDGTFWLATYDNEDEYGVEFNDDDKPYMIYDFLVDSGTYLEDDPRVKDFNEVIKRVIEFKNSKR